MTAVIQPRPVAGTLLVDLHASLLRLATDCAEALTADPQHYASVKALYFDAHGDDSELPSGDLVGFGNLEFELDSHFVEGSFMLGMVTETDANLFRLVHGMNFLLASVIPGNRLAVIDASTGAEKGFMNVMDGVALLPVSGKAGKPVQLLTVPFVTTLDYQLLG